MADDREVLREVWDGRIPAVFTLSSSEVETLTAPEPYFLLLPRHSYLPLVTDKVKKHLAKHVSAELTDSPVWFEHAGAALRWHLPIGVLYDQAVVANPEVRPPWAITIHFDKYPKDEILFCQSRETVETHFMSCVKEADQVKHGGKVMSAMQKRDHNQLWQGLQNDKFDQFWSINRRLMELLPGEKSYRHIPLRIYEGDAPVQRGLVRALEEERLRTLGDLLLELFPERDLDKVSTLIQGIEPPRDTPLQWLSEHLSYPDNYLHVCVK